MQLTLRIPKQKRTLFFPLLFLNHQLKAFLGQRHEKFNISSKPSILFCENKKIVLKFRSNLFLIALLFSFPSGSRTSSNSDLLCGFSKAGTQTIFYHSK